MSAHRVYIEKILIFWRRVKTQETRIVPDQLIVVGEQWNAATSSFVRLVGPWWRPVLVFACLLEAALFAEVEVIPSMDHPGDQKICVLQDLLAHSKRDDGQGVAVVCEASSLSFLSIMLKKTKVLNPTFLPEENALAAGEVLAGWERRGSQGVLLLSDHLLSSLPFLPSTVTTLVNWDLPVLSKKAFSLRLTTLLAAMTRQESGLQLVLLLGAQELGRPIISLLPWLSRTSALSNSALLNLATTARANLPPAPVCQRLADQGKCERQCCQHNHDIFDEELTSAGPGEGDEILFDVVEVESPVTYWVKLWGDRSQRIGASTAVRIARYLNKAGNTGIGKLEVGLQVAVMHEGYACRGVLTRIEERDNFQATVVTLRLIDSGRTHCFSVGDLHGLPPHLQSPCLPPAVLRVTVAGLKPAEDEVAWGSECFREVGGYLGRVAVLGRDALCRGRVIRIGKDRLFLDRCELLVRQHHVNSWVQLWETRACLLRDKWAEPQQKGALFDNLDSLSHECDSKLTCSTSVSKQGMGGPSPGELPTDKPCHVFISELFSPHIIFVQRADLLPKLCALRERMASDAPRLAERDEEWAPEVGEYVLVQKEDLAWERATVNELGGKVSLFLVDTGENMEVEMGQIFHCPPHFQVDPAFAVPCSLSSVAPFPGTTWSIEAGDFLFEMTTTRTGDVDEPFLVNCSAVNAESGHYQVSLAIVGKDDFDLDLARALVKREYAMWSSQAMGRDASCDSIRADLAEVI